MAKQQDFSKSENKDMDKNDKKSKDGLSSINPAYMIGAASALSGITALLAQRGKNAQIDRESGAYMNQKHAAKLNEQLANLATREAYTSGAYQAMMQGLQDAQIIAQTRASRAGSGVRLGVGSAKEIEASQRMSAAMNQIQIQKQTTAQANNHLLEASNYRVQQIIAQGNADAAKASKVNPLLSGVTGLISSAVQYDGLWQDGGKNKSALFDWLNKYF